jgi:hypothetical protein
MLSSEQVPEQIPGHVTLTGVVFDDLRLVYVPVPKAASTSILEALAQLAGVRPEERTRSRKLEVTRALTVHDGSTWGATHRLTGRGRAELERILRSDEWFRFTVVREPARRLWSAWVSKVLVRNPRFVLMYGGDLFPPPPASAEDVLDSFRRFMTGLPHRAEWADSHWSSQADLLGLGDVAYSHVGRVEKLDATAAEVGAHLRTEGAALPSLGAGNRSYLPFSAGVFDRSAHEACARWTARDCEAFGYEPLPYVSDGPDDDWFAAVEALIPAVHALIEQNERFLDLWRLLPERKGVRTRAVHAVRSARARAAASVPATSRATPRRARRSESARAA